jgi:D-alanyl-D-alanine endopeptidase (penicillin-binding protein 7)
LNPKQKGALVSKLVTYLVLTLFSLHCFAKADSYYILNVSTNKPIEATNPNEVLPVASITKIMTVLLVLEKQQDPNEELIVSAGPDSSRKISRGMKLKRSELIDLALICSDNKAAKTLADNYPSTNFVFEMNRRAVELGMYNTRYTDPTGLGIGNVSTAYDLTKLILVANQYMEFNVAALMTDANVIATRKKYNIIVTGRATNPLAGDENIRVAKTGFTNAARKCFVMLYEHNHQLYSVVVLGSKSSVERKKLLAEAVFKISLN